ncbi:retrovirus-related pol polyprotein from transposon TNT 1-94 [Tanacetum coccineum]
MEEDGKIKIDSMMVMILVSVRCRSKTFYIRRCFRSLCQKLNLQNSNQKGHFQNQCLKLVASKDKEVNIEARNSDDALVCCLKNTVEDHIMDSGASFHATYCKQKSERFKLRWTLKDVRYIPGLKRRLILVGKLYKEGYHVGFRDQQWKVTKGSLVIAHGNKRGSLYMVEDWWFGEAEEYFFHNVSEDKETTEIRAIGVAFDVAERLSQTFRSESTRIHVEAPKMLWADSVSTTYLINRIPYVPIGLRIPKEEWRGKDTSLTYLKVFGCDSFVKVKDVYGEAMKCTFIGSGSDEVRYSF